MSVTAFAETFHEGLAQLEASGTLSKTGVGRLDALIGEISKHLSVHSDDVYMVSCARTNNLNIRLTQGRAQDRHLVLGLGVIPNAPDVNKVVAACLKAGATFIGTGSAQYDAVAV